MSVNEWDDIVMNVCTECDFFTSDAAEADEHESETQHRVDEES